MNNQVRAMLRRSTARFFTETCLIEVQADSVGQWGQEGQLWNTVLDDWPCRVITPRPLSSPSSAQVGAQEQIVDTVRIASVYGTPFATNQRITVGGIVYQVVGLLTDRTDETDTQCIAVRAR